MSLSPWEKDVSFFLLGVEEAIILMGNWSSSVDHGSDLMQFSCISFWLMSGFSASFLAWKNRIFMFFQITNRSFAFSGLPLCLIAPSFAC